MQIHDIKRKTKNKAPKLVGRGGTRGKTSGKGTKGQNARSGRKKRPEMRDLIKMLPKLRGYAFATIQTKPVNINLEQIEKVFKAGQEINPQLLIEAGLIKLYKGTTPKVKILSDGEITKKFKVTGCLLSAKAKEKIEKAGGEVK